VCVDVACGAGAVSSLPQAVLDKKKPRDRERGSYSRQHFSVTYPKPRTAMGSGHQPSRRLDFAAVAFSLCGQETATGHPMQPTNKTGGGKGPNYMTCFN
jgi:hypothetical protein